MIFLSSVSPQLSLIMDTVLIKTQFNDYLKGNEVEGQAILFPYEKLRKGDHILAFQESIITKPDKAGYVSQHSDYIGVEGEVTEIGITFNQNESRKVQFIKVKKLIRPSDN
jgi:hypothetical protein